MLRHARNLLATTIIALVIAALAAAPAAATLPGSNGRITFMRFEADHWQVWVSKSDLSDAVQITDGTFESVCPVWSPDGRRIAFDSNQSDPDPTDDIGINDVYTMRADGTDISEGHRFPRLLGRARLVAGRLAHRVQQRPRRLPARQAIYVIRPDGTGMRRVTEKPRLGELAKFATLLARRQEARVHGVRPARPPPRRRGRRRDVRAVHDQPRRHAGCAGSRPGRRTRATRTGRPTGSGSCSRRSSSIPAAPRASGSSTRTGTTSSSSPTTRSTSTTPTAVPVRGLLRSGVVAGRSQHPVQPRRVRPRGRIDRPPDDEARRLRPGVGLDGARGRAPGRLGLGPTAALTRPNSDAGPGRPAIPPERVACAPNGRLAARFRASWARICPRAASTPAYDPILGPARPATATAGSFVTGLTRFGGAGYLPCDTGPAGAQSPGPTGGST